MFYVDPTTQSPWRDRFYQQILPSVVVFLAFVGLSLFSADTASRAVSRELRSENSERNQNLQFRIEDRIEAYQEMLTGTTGLFYASTEVTRDDWKNYIDSYDLSNRYPAVLAAGYAKVVPAKNIDSYINAIRKEKGFEKYTLFPEGKRDRYVVATFVEPSDESTLKGLGYDISSEPTRRSALERAELNGQPAITAPLKLLRDEDSTTSKTGFVLYVPVYTDASKENIQGFTYVGFRISEMLETITTPEFRDNFGFKLSDISSDSESPNVIYENANYKKLVDAGEQTTSSNIEIAGAVWKLESTISDEAINPSLRSRPSSALLGGIFFSAIVGLFIYVILGNRNRKILTKEGEKVQAAKDELLSLASHQLRTPATGVKQYVGMLREGLVGPLTDRQLELLNKAYDSNERQLNTINEMLVVAKSDAGHLKLSKSLTNINELVKEIVQDMQDLIEKKDQTIEVKITKTPIVINVDPQYLRMAIENLISNATKYTEEGGAIVVDLRKKKGSMVLKVTDNGVGVASKDQPLLFKKFSRIPNELTSQVPGSGIGLYLAKQVIDAHRGEIDFDSSEKKGTTVTITLLARN